MSSIRAVAKLVDGGAQDLPWGPQYAARLVALQRAGKTGKDLIDALFTDDWGPPPSVVIISGYDEAGQWVDIRLAYD